MCNVIDGKALAEKIKQGVRERADLYEKKYGRRIGLAVIRAGNDPASEIYVRSKIKACESCNISSFSYVFGDNVEKSELLELIGKLNSDPAVHGILVQLPLPKHLDEREILSAVSPRKDADGFHVINAGKLFLGERGGVTACTPRGIIELIKSVGTDIAGKHAVVLGRSNIVGKPVAALLLQNDATVTVCHSRTVGLKDITLTADILISAVGKKHIVTKDMVKKGAVVIDVGMNRVDGKLYGDVDFDGVKDVAGYITPVPGGVGPMTVAMLLANTADGAFDE